MKEKDKCPYKGSLETISSKKYAPKWLRCPECGRRLKPRFYDCHHNIDSQPCWHYIVPPHKKKGWWKKRKKK